MNSQFSALVDYTTKQLEKLKAKRYASSYDQEEIIKLSRLLCEASEIDYGTLYLDDSSDSLLDLDDIVKGHNIMCDNIIEEILDDGYKSHNGHRCRVFQGSINMLKGLLHDLNGEFEYMELEQQAQEKAV